MTKAEMIEHIIDTLEYFRESPDMFQPGDSEEITANCGGFDAAISESQDTASSL